MSPFDDDIHIPCIDVELKGQLHLVQGSDSVVLFVHGSGSGRLSPRNQFVAERLQAAGHSTLLFDLLTESEERIDERTRHLRFDIDLLARRLETVTKWLRSDTRLKGVSVGFFGASTGGGAALVAAARLGGDVHAVVSRGGRPDLAGEALPHVVAPTLLVVGGLDEAVLELNRDAMARMRPGVARLEIVPGATHLFEEEGTLARVAELASDWFDEHLTLGGGAQRRETAESVRLGDRH